MGVQRQFLRSLTLLQPTIQASQSKQIVCRSKSILSNANLDNVNQNIDEICQRLDNANAVVVMAGAGLSTASGIPDFRSPNTGIYANLSKFNLPYPEALFEIDYFKKNPRAFNTWAKEFFPGENYLPNKAHYFLKVLEDKSKLSRVYTQNIDGLELEAGLSQDKVIEAHGTFTSAACTNCQKKADIKDVKKEIMLDRDPICPSCGGWLKPNIVFFGEALPARFVKTMKKKTDLHHIFRFFDEAELDCEFSDQLVCIGTSLEVYPFAGTMNCHPIVPSVYDSHNP